MPKCIEFLPCDWLISNLCYQAIEQVYLIKWPVSVCMGVTTIYFGGDVLYSQYWKNTNLSPPIIGLLYCNMWHMICPPFMNPGCSLVDLLLFPIYFQFRKNKGNSATMSNQQQKAEINCPINVVSYAKSCLQSVFFRLVQPMRTRSHNVLILHMCIGWSSQISMGNLALSFRRWDYSSILRIAVSPIYIGVNNTITKKDSIFLPACHVTINQHQIIRFKWQKVLECLHYT